MSVPSPPVALAPGGCSAIYDNTLYSFTQQAFQSLPLQAGAKWAQLEMGVAVNGSRCVLGTQNSQDVLYIVGGQVNSSSNSTSTSSVPSNYTGLQSWNFASHTWSTVPFGSASVVQNRLNHSVTFLNDSQSILVYSGYQNDGDTDTSSTFTIDTNSPLAIAQSYPSHEAPPGISPMLLQWNSSHAVMVGGSANNQQIWTFGIVDGWQEAPVVLQKGLGNVEGLQAAMVQGGNSSKILELFDMSQTPAVVTQLLLDPGNGDDAPAQTKRHVPVVQTFDLTDSPVYNDSFAPNTTRAGYNLAQAADGLVAISGGAAGNADSVVLFNQTSNAWIDGAQFFNPSASATASSSTTSSAAVPSLSPSTTSSPSATPAAASNSSAPNERIVLAAVLGSVLGTLALLGLALAICLCTRRRRRNQFLPQDKPSTGDQAPMTSVRAPGSRSNHQPTTIGSPDTISRSNFSQRELASPDLPSPGPDLPIRAVNAVVGTPTLVRAPEHTHSPAGPDRGWSQYFDGQASQRESTAGPDTDPDAKHVSRLTAYTETSAYSRTTDRESAAVDPLHINPHGAQRSAHNTFLDESESRPTTKGTLSDETQGERTWDPLGLNDGRAGYDARPVSSMYGGTQRDSRSGFPIVPPSRSASMVQPDGQGDRGLRTIASRDLREIPEARALRSNPPSMVSSLSTPPSRSGSRPVSRPVSRWTSGAMDDMSWLNIRQE